MDKVYWIRVESKAPSKSYFNGVLSGLPGVRCAVAYEEFELPIYFRVQFETGLILDAEGRTVQNRFHLVPAHELDDFYPCVKGATK